MALHYYWGDTEAWKNPIILNDNHPKYQLIEEAVEADGSSWRKDEETGKIIHTRPLLETITWLGLLLDLRGITHENVSEWLFRIKYGRRVRWLAGRDGMVSEWTAEGWDVRHITREDLLTLVGLTTNVTNSTRDKWLKRVHEQLVEETEKEVDNA
jgi:hypothetical protein